MEELVREEAPGGAAAEGVGSDIVEARLMIDAVYEAEF